MNALSTIANFCIKAFRSETTVSKLNYNKSLRGSISPGRIWWDWQAYLDAHGDYQAVTGNGNQGHFELKLNWIVLC